jgi:hypothetical protein
LPDGTYWAVLALPLAEAPLRASADAGRLRATKNVSSAM